MNPKKRSKTAEIVAVSRARHLLRYSSPHIFNDPYAINLVGSKWRFILKNNVLDKFISNKLSHFFPIMMQHVIRARYVEDELEKMQKENKEIQYVLLGAGYDSFAYRNKNKNIKIFELDLAGSIKSKQEKIKKIGVETPKNLKVIPFNFEMGNLQNTIEKNGFDRNKLTMFNWMGVSYYLSTPAIIKTLNEIGKFVIEGSQIIFDFTIPKTLLTIKEKEVFTKMLDWVEKRGEPMISHFDPKKIEEKLNTNSIWKKTKNVSPSELMKKYIGKRNDLPKLTPLLWIALWEK